MHKTKDKILFFGPIPPPITGQSVAFKEVYDNLTDKKVLINTAHFGNNKVLNTIYTLFQIVYCFIFKKFDTVYFTCSRSSFGFIKDYFLILASHFFRKKIVNHVHGADFSDFINKSRILKPLILSSYNKIDATIVLLDVMQQDFTKFSNMQLFTVHNSYSDIFDSSVVSSKTELTILYFSNIMETKGIMEFLESAKQILLKNDSVKYVIAGSFLADEKSSEKEIKHKFTSELLKIQDEFGLERIKYKGVVSGLDKVEVFQESSVFVLPTYYKTEAFPITFIEAMRTGNAIVSTDHNYIPEIISKKNGLLVKKKSIEQLVAAQDFLINHPIKLREIQDYNIVYSKSNYSPQNYISQINNIFLQINKHNNQ